MIFEIYLKILKKVKNISNFQKEFYFVKYHKTIFKYSQKLFFIIVFKNSYQTKFLNNLI